MKYLVTGGAGFIGSNIAAELVRQGEEVTVIDNLSTGRKENLAPLLKKMTFLQGDIRDLAFLKKSLKGVDFVLHQAALPSVPRSIADPIDSNENNISGTLNVLVAARDAGVKRVVYAASSSAYGNAEAEWKTEELPAKPKSPYALTKYAGEVYCRLFYELYGLETISLRYFNVFGPNQDPKGDYAAVIPKFTDLMLRKQRPIIFGNGEQSRDFTHVENNVSANILACKAKKTRGEVMNIACGESISLNALVQKMNCLLGTDIKPKYEPARKGDVLTSKAAIDLAWEKIGYAPKINFSEGLAKYLDWFKNQKKF